MQLPLLSLAHLTMLDAHPLKLIDAAVAGKFDAIGLRIVPPMPTDTIVPVIGDERLLHDLQLKMDDTGIRILDVEAVWLVPDMDVGALGPALETARRLGANNLLVCGNDPIESRAIDSFAMLCQLAAKYDINVAIENLPYIQTATVQQSHRMAKEAAQPNGRVLIDALHLFRSGGSPDDVAKLEPEWFAYCQISDAKGPRAGTIDELRKEARTGRFYPGLGEFPLERLLDAFPPGLPIGVEAPCADYAHLPVTERGRICGEATRSFLERYFSKRSSTPS